MTWDFIDPRSPRSVGPAPFAFAIRRRDGGRTFIVRFTDDGLALAGLAMGGRLALAMGAGDDAGRLLLVAHPIGPYRARRHGNHAIVECGLVPAAMVDWLTLTACDGAIVDVPGRGKGLVLTLPAEAFRSGGAHLTAHRASVSAASEPEAPALVTPETGEHPGQALEPEAGAGGDASSSERPRVHVGPGRRRADASPPPHQSAVAEDTPAPAAPAEEPLPAAEPLRREPDPRPASVWTEERVAELRRLADEGLSGKEAGERLGCARGAVVQAASRFGISFHGKMGRKAKEPEPKAADRFLKRGGSWTDERVAQLRQLAADGRTSAQAGDAMGLSLGGVRKAAARHGIKFGGPPKAKPAPPSPRPLHERERAFLARLLEFRAKGRPIDGPALVSALGAPPGPSFAMASRLVVAGWLSRHDNGAVRTWKVLRGLDGKPLDTPALEGTRVEIRDGVRVTICPPRHAAGPAFGQNLSSRVGARAAWGGP